MKRYRIGKWGQLEDAPEGATGQFTVRSVFVWIAVAVVFFLFIFALFYVPRHQGFYVPEQPQVSHADQL